MIGSKKSITQFSVFVSLLLLCIFSFLSCSKSSINEPYTGGPSTQDDATLRKEIIGTWGITGYKISYLDDGTFIDSSFVQPTDNQSLELWQVTKGSYKIYNGILYSYNLDYIYLHKNTSIPISQSVTGSEISISNNELSFVPVDIFIPNGGTDGISGYWSTKVWLTTDSSSPEYRGYLQCSYQIDPSTSTFFHTIVFLNDFNMKAIMDRDLYDYKKPYLKLVINNSLTTVKVEFKNGAMYWYFPNKGTLTKE